MAPSRSALLAWMALLTIPVHAGEVRIAVAVPRTGTVATAGDQVTAGAKLAAQMIDESGGVRGDTIVVDVEDDACDPRQAVSVANRIVGSGITLVDGHVCSAASIAAAPIYAENHVLMMTPATVSAKLTDTASAKGWPTIFRVYTRDDLQGAMMGAFLAEHYAGRKIVFVHDKGTYGKGLADQVNASLNAHGVREIFTEGITPGEKDYSAVVGKLKALGAEVVYFGGYPPEGGLILRQAHDQGFKFQMVTTSGFAAPEFWSVAGEAGDGTIFPFPPDPTKLPSAQAVMERFRAEGLPADGFTLFSFATIQAIAEGVRRAGSQDGTAVAKAIREGGPIATVLGPLSFDPKGDALGITYEMQVWHDGRYAPLRGLAP